MENLVPLGTGNSRFMKSNISPSTTLAQLIQMLNNGTFPYDVGTINPAGISQQGTPLNKDTLLKDATAGLYGLGSDAVPDDVLNKLSKSILYYSTVTPKYQEVTVNLSTAQEGDIVQLPENGVLVDFYVAKLDYESTLNGAGRVLVVRKDCYDNRVWDSGRVNAYARSDLDSWFNSTYKNMLNADIRSLIGTTKFRYTPGDRNNRVDTLERAVFALSMTELGQSASWFNVEGSALPIASTLQIAYRNGSPSTQWTRSPVNSGIGAVGYMFADGKDGNGNCDGSNGSRPCFTLPSTFSATYYVDSSGNLHDEQEYESAGSTTDVQGNPITIGTQIATGSYVGTGTYGASNPNTLTFDFEPKLIVLHSSTFRSNNVINLPYYGMFLKGQTSYTVLSSESYQVDEASVISFNENTVSWYSSNAAAQYNDSGRTIEYVAIG